MRIEKELWGIYHNQEVYLYTLTSAAGSVVQLTNYGARIVAVKVPDGDGELADVVLGFKALAPYLEDETFMGATIGRFANRISNASFTLDHHRWTLEANDGSNCNHSGSAGFDHRVFQVAEVSEVAGDGGLTVKVVFCLKDAHASGGFPGNLFLRVSYCWANDSDELTVCYDAESDRRGVLNLTNHSYFNLSAKSGLSGDFQNCLMHRLEIEADKVLEVDSEYIPTGRKLPVGRDRVSGMIKDQCLAAGNGALIATDGQPDSPDLCEEPADFKGLNSCFELRAARKPLACRLICDRSGRMLEVRTSYPGLLVYTGDSLHSQIAGVWGRPYSAFDGVALECQYYPDSPNQPGFPPAIIEAGKPYREYIAYRFSTLKKERCYRGNKN